MQCITSFSKMSLKALRIKALKLTIEDECLSLERSLTVIFNQLSQHTSLSKTSHLRLMNHIRKNNMSYHYSKKIL